jgi:hypothetical protein
MIFLLTALLGAAKCNTALLPSLVVGLCVGGLGTRPPAHAADLRQDCPNRAVSWGSASRFGDSAKVSLGDSAKMSLGDSTFRLLPRWILPWACLASWLVGPDRLVFSGGPAAAQPGCGPAKGWGVGQIWPTVPRRGRGTARGLARARAGGIERPRRGCDLPRHTRAAGLPGGRCRLQPSNSVPVAGHLNGLESVGRTRALPSTRIPVLGRPHIRVPHIQARAGRCLELEFESFAIQRNSIRGSADPLLRRAEHDGHHDAVCRRFVRRACQLVSSGKVVVVSLQTFARVEPGWSTERVRGRHRGSAGGGEGCQGLGHCSDGLS